jgi:hypothetical protein
MLGSRLQSFVDKIKCTETLFSGYPLTEEAIGQNPISRHHTFKAEKVIAVTATASSGFFAKNNLICGINLNLGSRSYGWIIQN